MWDDIGRMAMGTALFSVAVNVVLAPLVYAEHRANPRVRAQCGHLSRAVDLLRAYGETRVIMLAQGVPPKFCHACLRAMTIRCAICGEPIFIGDPIALYYVAYPDDEEEWAAWHEDDGKLYMVGCLRMGCATGVSWAGAWTPKGVGRLPKDTAW